MWALAYRTKGFVSGIVIPVHPLINVVHENFLNSLSPTLLAPWINPFTMSPTTAVLNDLSLSKTTTIHFRIVSGLKRVLSLLQTMRKNREKQNITICY